MRFDEAIKGAIDGNVALFKNTVGEIYPFVLIQVVVAKNKKEFFHVQNINDGTLSLIDSSGISDVKFETYCENFSMKYHAFVQAQHLSFQKEVDKSQSKVVEFPKPKIIS